MRDTAARALRADDEFVHFSELRSLRPASDLLEEAPARRREPSPRSAPGRAYGSHRRSDGAAPRRISGAQGARRTIEITGQAVAPRRRPHSSAAFVARPDRAALWAFLFALFLVLMALATAHG